MLTLIPFRKVLLLMVSVYHSFLATNVEAVTHQGYLTCDSTLQRVAACQNATVNISCVFGTIHILNATYGRQFDASSNFCEHGKPSGQQKHAVAGDDNNDQKSATRKRTVVIAADAAQDHDASPKISASSASASTPTARCRAPTSYFNAFVRCEGRQECSIDARDKVFGDPCPGLSKYLVVDYTCRGFVNSTLIDLRQEALETKLNTIQEQTLLNQEEIRSIRTATEGLEAFTHAIQSSINVMQQLVTQMSGVGETVVQMNRKIQAIESQLQSNNLVVKKLQTNVAAVEQYQKEEAEAEPEPQPVTVTNQGGKSTPKSVAMIVLPNKETTMMTTSPGYNTIMY